VAGYMTHLLLDEIWYHDLFNPYFLNGDNELPVQHRLVLHNVLRLAVEDDLEPQVSPASIQSFSSLPISYALPPIDDATLAEWRDLIRSEFSPGGEKRSADVFAERLRVPVEELTMILHSPARMQDEVFSRLPAGRSERVIDDGIRLGIDLLAVYLNGHAREEMPTTVANMLRKSRHV